MNNRGSILRFVVLVVTCNIQVVVSANCIDTIDIGLIQEATASIYIDTRDSRSFNEYKIPGSINVSAKSVKLKKTWRNKPVYLIGYGYDDYRMLELCRQLSLSGFEDVSAIKNGVLSHITNIRPRDDTIFYISVQELVNVLNAHQGILLDISEGREADSLGINGVHYSSAENISAFRKAAEQSRTISHLPIIIISSDTSQYKALHSLNNKSDNPVYFAEGGIDALKKYIKHIDDIRRKTKFELQGVKACGE